MGKLIIAVGLTAAATSAFAVSESTYVGRQEQRAVIRIDNNAGAYETSVLFKDDPGTEGIYGFTATNKPVPGKAYLLRKHSNYAKTGNCELQAKWTDAGNLQVKAGKSCSKAESAALSGNYAYSRQMSEIPAQYRGVWRTDCSKKQGGEKVSGLLIKQSGFATDNSDGGNAGIYNVQKLDNGHIRISGYQIVEDAPTFGSSSLILKKNGTRLKATGEHHGQKFNLNLSKCSR